MIRKRPAGSTGFLNFAYFCVFLILANSSRADETAILSPELLPSPPPPALLPAAEVPPDPAPQILEEEAAAMRALQQEKDVALLRAIAAGDLEGVKAALLAGANANATVPQPSPDGLAEPFVKTPLYYYLKSESGFTALMFAAGVANEQIVRTLLDAGADRSLPTKRNKTRAIQLAARAKHVEIQRLLLGIGPESPARAVEVQVDLPSQTVTIREHGSLRLTSPISSGTSSNPTPTGTFVVTDKWKSWTSTIYKVKMPHFLRLSCSEVGLHAGNLPGYPASHGCIRLPHKEAREIFDLVPIGALVTVR